LHNHQYINHDKNPNEMDDLIYKQRFFYTSLTNTKTENPGL